MLVFATSAVAEDKPSGDNTAAQGVRLRVAWLAIQFLAAATISGLATDMPTPSDDKQIPRLEQMVAEGLVVLSDVDVITYTHRLEEPAGAGDGESSAESAS